MPKVSVVVLTNSKPELLREVLGSIVAQDHQPLEPIVVLNGPHPIIETIVAEFPSVRLIKNDTNIGFAPGMNQGVRESTGEYVYISANDIVLSRNYISEMVRAAEADPNWGLAGGVWRNQSSADKEVFAAGGSVRFGLTGMSGTVHSTVPDTDRPYDTDWISGAGIFTRKDTWEALGGYREEFFFHFEDIELCIRVRRSGGYVRVVPTAVLYHHEHPNGISQNRVVEFHKLKNYLSINALYGPLAAIPLVSAKYILYTAPRIACYLRSPGLMFKAWADAITRLPAMLWDRHKPVKQLTRVSYALEDGKTQWA
jgi:GT2 family glycosyltransferase